MNLLFPCNTEEQTVCQDCRNYYDRVDGTVFSTMYWRKYFPEQKSHLLKMVDHVPQMNAT